MQASATLTFSLTVSAMPRNQHRKIGNLFDVKLKAIDNMHAAGTEIILVTTLVNNVNNEEVGPIINFARDNPGKIAFIAFQPVSFTGRDEEITDERRLRQRYTLSHLAHDVKDQVGITEPCRDWFPISIMGAFADAADVAHGPQAQWGQVSCGCHPNCGVGTALMINKTDQGHGAGSRVHQRAAVRAGYPQDHRRGPQQVDDEPADGSGSSEELRSVQGAESRSTCSTLLKKFDKSFAL